MWALPLHQIKKEACLAQEMSGSRVANAAFSCVDAMRRPVLGHDFAYTNAHRIKALTMTLPALAYFVCDFDPVILHIWGPLSLRWYGLAYVAGFAVAYLLWTRAVSQGATPLNKDNVEELMTWGIAGVLVGGRLGYMLMYDFGTLVADPLSLIRVYEGGMAFHGGALGCIGAVFFVALRRGLSPFRVGDLGVMGVAWGLFFGRIANFINGELWGKPSSLPWAVVFPKAPLAEGAPIVQVDYAGLSIMANLRHPSQLYEAALEGLALGIIMLLLFWRTGLRERVPGLISGLFLVLYSVSRIICELFREPDAGVTPILGFSRGTVFSFFLFEIGFAVMVVAIVMAKRRTRLADSGGRNS